MIVTAPIDLDQLADSDSTSKPIELEVWSYWYENGYPVDEIQEAYVAVNQKTDDENTGHIVCKVQTLSKPIDHADVVEDSVEVWCCDCRDYKFNQSVELEDKSVAYWGQCKHILACSKEARAEQDDSQTEIGF